MSFTEHSENGVVYMTAPNINITHGFTTRFGGVSEGIFSSLNLNASGKDSREYIRENYIRLTDALNIPLSKMVYTKQVHGTHIRTVTSADSVDIFDFTDEGCDGLLTNEKGLPIIAFTADCIPVLMHDPVKNAIGAIHAGWRGTVSDIVGIAVERMVQDFGCDPKNIQCAIGPGIDKCCFETDLDVPEAVLSVLGEKGHDYIEPKGIKYYVNLKGVNRELLLRRGIPSENIEISDECTMCSHEKYWSNRYTKGNRGCQACVIMM